MDWGTLINYPLTLWVRCNNTLGTWIPISFYYKWTYWYPKMRPILFYGSYLNNNITVKGFPPNKDMSQVIQLFSFSRRYEPHSNVWAEFSISVCLWIRFTVVQQNTILWKIFEFYVKYLIFSCPSTRQVLDFSLFTTINGAVY